MSIFLALTMLFVCAGCTNVDALGTPENVYYVDVKIWQLESTTKVEIYDQNEELSYTIKGKFWTFLTDPMDVFDQDGTCIGKITDDYNIFRQDDHDIIIEDKVVVEMEGEFDLLGNTYYLRRDDKIIGTAKFDIVNWTGIISDNNGNVIASYNRASLEKDIMLKDFEVKIYDNNVFSDLEVLMIIAAYHSDRMADERASNNSSSSSNNSSN